MNASLSSLSAFKSNCLARSETKPLWEELYLCAKKVTLKGKPWEMLSDPEKRAGLSTLRLYRQAMLRLATKCRQKNINVPDFNSNDIRSLTDPP